MNPIIRSGVIQMCSRGDVNDNLARASQLARRARQQGAQLIVIPENFCLIETLQRKLEIAEDVESPGPIITTMQELARELGAHLILGGLPTRGAPGRCRNSSILLDATGEVRSVYHKIHLFDIDIPDGTTFKESELVEPGDAPVQVDALGATIGMTICYDLRFPELYRALTRGGATIVTVPAAFTLHTGKDHWIPLLRARAIENQVYVLAADQYGRHTPERYSYGKSCIVDPWGAVIASVSDGEGVAVADLDLSYVRKLRQQLPCLEHQKL